MKTGKLVLGILGGLAAGATLGILFAPEKGTKTRRKIMDKGSNYAEELKDKFESVVEAVTQKYEKILKDGENLFTEEKTKFSDAKKEMKNLSN